jgi:hypothetical protein
MRKQKITIEIEIESMNTFDLDYTGEFSSKLQRAINKKVNRKIVSWNFWSNNKMRLTRILNKCESN